MEINEKIRELREDNDLTLADLAQILGTTYQYYQKYEKGKYPIPSKHIKTLCEYYQVSADYVLGLPKGLAWPREPKEKK